MTGQQIDRDRLRELADEYDDSTIDGGPDAAAGAIRQLLEALDQAEAEVKRLSWRCGHLADKYTQDTDELRQEADQAEQRIRDLTQEVRDERAACLDQIEQVQARDARIKSVRDVLADYAPDEDVSSPVPATPIRRALDGDQ